jgi:hypothetical protein
MLHSREIRQLKEFDYRPAEFTSIATLTIGRSIYTTESMLLFYQDELGWIKCGFLDVKGRRNFIAAEGIVRAKKSTPLAVVGVTGDGRSFFNYNMPVEVCV